MAQLHPMEDSKVYKNSPSIAYMEQDRKYKKTLKRYRQVLQREMMIMPKQLENFPAPVLCPLCEVPVITQARTARTANQRFMLVSSIFLSFGLATTQQLQENKNVEHVCPSCRCVIATQVAEMGGHIHNTNVHTFYTGLPSNDASQAGPSGQSKQGISASGFNISGYSTVRFGNDVYIQAVDQTAASNQINQIDGAGVQ